MTIESGSNSPRILFEKVSIGSYGSSSIGALLEDDELDELLDIELDEELEPLELLELDELELEELEDELLEELELLVELSFLELVALELELDDSELEVVLLVVELVSSTLDVEVTFVSWLEEKLVSLEALTEQEDRSKAANTLNE